jgi:hypothetical protein
MQFVIAHRELIPETMIARDLGADIGEVEAPTKPLANQNSTSAAQY